MKRCGYFLLLLSVALPMFAGDPTKTYEACDDIPSFDEQLEHGKDRQKLVLWGHERDIKGQFVDNLSQFIKTSTKITHLTIRKPMMTTFGFFLKPPFGNAIFESLQDNRSLIKLEIEPDFAGIAAHSIADLVTVISKNKTLEELVVGFDADLTHANYQNLAWALRENKTLKKIDFTFYGICSDYATFLVENLAHNNMLTSISLKYCGGTCPNLQLIREILAKAARN